MTLPFAPRRLAIAAFAAALSVLLAACFVLPGKFAETLDLRKDGQFSYSYKGEIFVLGLSKLAEMGGSMGGSAASGPFEAQPCSNEDTGSERPCTKVELDQQKADWDEIQKATQAKKKEDNEAMKAALGGIDPQDPKAGEELAERLRRQAGWNSVIYKGDGLYEVDFAISGVLAYDFSFPTIERIPTLLPFLALSRRADGSVRIDSPVFQNTAGASGMSGVMGGQTAVAARSDDPALKGMPSIDGTLTLTTDGAILANNTDEGPAADPAGKRLVWKINARNAAAPMALVQLGK